MGKKHSNKAAGINSRIREDREFRKNDIYEAEDNDPQENIDAGRRYDNVESFEYELPDNFEDEEIDEDEAFNSEDEKLYGHLFDSKGSNKDGMEYSEDSESKSESESEVEAEGLGGLSSEESDENELEDFFNRDDYSETSSSLDSSGEDEGDGGDDDERRRALVAAVTDRAGHMEGKHQQKVRTEAYPESEFNLPGGSGDLTIADLIGGLGSSAQKLGPALKTLEKLEKKDSPLSAPLPGPIRDRQQRKAGYESAKAEAAKWVPIVKAQREAPTVHFTADKSAVAKIASSTAALVAQHTPQTAMEAEVAALLEAAGAGTAAAVAEAEDALAGRSLSIEEAKERRNRLAKMRALLFYHELKSKRMKKIKSKEYRRKLKKAEKRKALMGEDGDKEALHAELEDAEFQRARERLTLKHRNTSRWARRALKRGAEALDEDTREAVAEQLRLGKELRSRVDRLKPVRGDDDSDASTSASEESMNEESDDDHQTLADPSQRYQKKLRDAAMDVLENGGNDHGGEEPKKGLLALPFMKKAREKRRLAAEAEARQLLEELEGTDASGGLGAGRLKFGTGTGTGTALRAATLTDEDTESDEHEDADAKLERLANIKNNSKESAAPLTLAPIGTMQSDIFIEKRPSGAKATKPGNHASKNRAASVVTAQAGHSFLEAKQFQGVKPGYVFKKGAHGLGYYSDSGQEKRNPQTAADAEEVSGVKHKGGPLLGFSQEELVRKAFAGDDVVGEFRAAKAKDIEAELPKEDIPGVLPGWGTWAKHQKKEPGWLVEAKRKAEQKKLAAAASRRDVKLRDVIVSEKWDRKAARYKTASVPFPFDSRETYERAMRQPLGRDFNTDASFRDLTRPAVIKDAGVIIEPARFSVSAAKYDAEQVGKRGKRPSVKVVAGGLSKRSRVK